MSNVSKELLREYIKEQNFTNANDILNGLKEIFKDVLQESLEAEMDEALDYKKLILKKAINIKLKMFIAFYHATLLEVSLDTSASITTPSFVDIMVLSLLIEADRPIICFSKRISR